MHLNLIVIIDLFLKFLDAITNLHICCLSARSPMLTDTSILLCTLRSYVHCYSYSLQVPYKIASRFYFHSLSKLSPLPYSFATPLLTLRLQLSSSYLFSTCPVVNLSRHLSFCCHQHLIKSNLILVGVPFYYFQKSSLPHYFFFFAPQLALPWQPLSSRFFITYSLVSLHRISSLLLSTPNNIETYHDRDYV